MSDIEDIREQKLEEYRQRAAAGDAAADSTAADSPPDEPVAVEGRDHLRELTDRYDVVLVDFYADWCGPCQMMEPAVEAVAAETDAAVAKVDIDAHQGLAAEYNVQGVPTLVVFAGGEPAERVVGAQQEARLTELVERH